MSDDHAKALALAAASRWDDAHALIQQRDDPLACLIHGYLHRVEGDMANAAYWYGRAGQAMPGNSLDEEHERLGRLS